MKLRARRFAVLLAWTLLARPAAAEVYAWVDEDGIIHFEDQPPTTRKKTKKLQLPPGESRADPLPARPAPSRVEGRDRAPSRQQPASSARAPRPAPPVELYTTSWCPWCKKARAYFSSRGIRFTDHDIETESGALRRKLGIDGSKSVPTAIIGGRVVEGYSPSAYQAALEQP